MTQEAVPVDVSAMPELARLAEDVARSGQPRLLTCGERDVAMIVPVAKRGVRRRKKPLTAAEREAAINAAFGMWKDRSPIPRRGKGVTQADIEATLSTFGAWKGHIDAEAFKREIKEGREDHRWPSEQ